MKTHMLAAAVATLTLGTFLSSAKADDRILSQTQFGSRSHVDDLALELRNDAVAVLWEMYNNYSLNPGFRETYSEMYKLMLDAEHIHDLVHAGYHLRQIADDEIAIDLRQIDELFHHVEEDIIGWTPSFRGRRHIHGHFNDTYGFTVHSPIFRNQLQLKMAQLEETLHHIMSDYGVTSQLPAATNEAPLPPNLGVQAAPQVPQTP